MIPQNWAEKPPPPQAVTSSVRSGWHHTGEYPKSPYSNPVSVKYSIPVILVRVSEGATHTSFEVSEQASF